MAKEYTQFPIPYEQDESNLVDVVTDLNYLTVIVAGVGRRAITGGNFRKDLIKNRPLATVNENHRVLLYDEVGDLVQKGIVNNYVHPDHTGEVTSTGDGDQVITPNAVTYAKIQQVTAGRLLGRSDTLGNVQEIVVGDNLTLSGGRLDATASQYVHPDHTGDAPSAGEGPTLVVGWRGVGLHDSFHSVTDGKIPVYRSSSGQWMLEDKPASGSTPALNDLTDVVITGPVADNEVLSYDSASGNWINNTYTEAGIATTTSGLAQFPNNSTASSQLAAIMTDETGSGALVFAANPTLAAVNITSGTFDNADITLGNDLDVGSSAIISTGGNDILLSPDGALILDYATWPAADGAAGTFLQTDGFGVLSWGVPPGGGDVVGPPGAVANAIARYDGTTGKAIKNSVWTLSDAGVLTSGGTLVMGTTPIHGTSSNQNITWSASAAAYNVPGGHSHEFRIDTESRLSVNEQTIVALERFECQFASALKLPVGTTAQRPAVPVEGDLRINTTTGTTEVYRGGGWVDLEATGAKTLAELTDVTITTPANGQVLTYQGGEWVNQAVAGGGDVVGPASATADALCLFDGTTGKLIKNSGWTITSSVMTAGGNLKTAGNTIEGVNDQQTQTWSAGGLSFGLAAGMSYGFLIDAGVVVSITGSSVVYGVPVDFQNNAATFTPQAATGTTTTTNIDWGLGLKVNFTFGAGNEAFTFTDPPGACNLILRMKQDGVGGRNATWPVNVIWQGGTAPDLSTSGANVVDLIALYFDGTDYYGVASRNFS